MKNILILGSGAREKIIAEKLKGNNIYILDATFEEIRHFCNINNIHIVIPSTEKYLCDGIVDYLQQHIKYISVFGPTKAQAIIEGSKYYSKTLMSLLKIPTSKYSYYKNKDECINHINNKISSVKDIVIKYSGLAKGKGVYLPETYKEAESAIYKLFENGDEGIIIEDRLVGTEVSILAFCNGKECNLMPQAQDYKRIYDNNLGPNTGGMGAICPVNILNSHELILVKKHIDNVVKELHYKGILYAGLIKTNIGIYFLEFNCRFGDPEAQVILNLLNTKLLYIIENCINGTKSNIIWNTKNISTAVVLSHEDYPYKSLQEPVEINYISKLDSNVKIYESNVTIKNNIKYTTGGRVLTMVSVDNNLYKSLQNIYNNIYKISFKGAYYRRDIGSNNIITTNNIIINKYIGILASGNGTCLDKLLQSKYQKQIKVIITDNNNASVIKKAQKYNINYIFISKDVKETNTIYYEKIVNILRQFNIDILILAGYMKIIPPIVFNNFHTVNIHPSLLPKYKNMVDMNIHNKVIKNGDKFSGCTLHEVTENVDCGKILLQKQYKLLENESANILKQHIQNLEQLCIVEYITYYFNSISTINYNINIKESNNFVDNLRKNNSFIGDFCAKFKYNEYNLAASCDGCGTKLDLANEYNKLDNIGIDLVAMNVNDLLVCGAKPLFFMDYIAIDKMDIIKCNTIINSINIGCDIANCDLIGGETAELKKMYLVNKFDIAGFCIGDFVYNFPNKENINNTCNLYGIPSSGIHSNGYTLIRDILKNMNTNSINNINIDDILTPTRIYMELLELYKLFPDNIFGVAHITGGGYNDNLNRILPNNLSYKLDDWEFSNIFEWIQQESKLTKEEMLSIFNCGYGVVIISDIDLTSIEFTEIHKIGKIISK